MFYGECNQFAGIKGTASNLCDSVGNYTPEQFQTDFPQFYKSDNTLLIPAHTLQMFIDRANAAIQPCKWLDSWRYAVGLYVAHYVTLYLRTYAEHSETAQQAATTGALIGVVKSATLGDSSVTYDTDALTRGTAEWGSLNATQYGQTLASEARLIGMGGSYVI